MTKHNETRNEAFALIEEHGPMTAQEIGEALGRPHGPIYYSLRRASNVKPTKLCYIKSYKRNEDYKVHRADWVAVWALGDKNDKKRPGPMSKSEGGKRYYAKHKHKISVKSMLKYRQKNKQPINIALHWFQTLTKKAA